MALSNRQILLIVVIVCIALIGSWCGAIVWVSYYSTDRLSRLNLWIEDVQSGEGYLITDKGTNYSAQFSPNGDAIVYVHRRNNNEDHGPADIMLYSLNGKTTTPLVNDGQECGDPSWGPNGERILYKSRKDGQLDLWIYSLLDGSSTQITHDADTEFEPVWAPDGKWVVFVQHDNASMRELFLLSLEDGAKRQLTHQNSIHHNPQHLAWVPNSEEIAYSSYFSLIGVSP